MRESSTYQAILAEGRQEGRQEGRADGERDLLVAQGTKRFGEPPAEVSRRLAGIREERELRRLALRLLDVETWGDLLA